MNRKVILLQQHTHSRKAWLAGKSSLPKAMRQGYLGIFAKVHGKYDSKYARNDCLVAIIIPKIRASMKSTLHLNLLLKDVMSSKKGITRRFVGYISTFKYILSKNSTKEKTCR